MSSNSGFFSRVIGKIAGSDLGRRLIGKAAHGVKHVIGKMHHSWHGAKQAVPALQHVEDVASALAGANDPKSSYNIARGLLDIGEKYGDGEYNAHYAKSLARGKFSKLPPAPIKARAMRARELAEARGLV